MLPQACYASSAGIAEWLSFLLHPIRWCLTVLVCSIVSDPKFGQLSKFVSARFLHSKVTFSPFVIEKYFVGEVLQYFVNILFFITFNFYFVQWL